MKLWIGKNYMRGAVALLLLCGTLFLTATVVFHLLSPKLEKVKFKEELI